MYEPCFPNYRCTYDPAPVSIQTKTTYIIYFRSHIKLKLLHWFLKQNVDFKIFRASDNVVPIQPGYTSNVEETSSFIAVFTLHKMIKSIARYVNAAIKQNPRWNRNCQYSLEGLKLCYVTGMIQWSSHFCKNFFFWNFGRKSIFKFPRRKLKLLNSDKIYVLKKRWNVVRKQIMIQSL